MKIEPEDLLVCVECMTAAQKASFCELLDPAPPSMGEQLVQNLTEMLDEFDAGKAAAGYPMAGAGVQGPPYVHPGQQRAQGPRKDLVGPALGPGMVGWILGNWRDDRDACAGAQAASRPPSAVDSPDAPDKLQGRWDLARARWQRTFGEDPIPMVTIKLAASATALDTIEGMLYDKGVKNRDPERCGCGCGYVIGCAGYANFSNMKR